MQYDVILFRLLLFIVLFSTCRFVVKGVVTNMPHMRSCIANPAFQKGDYDTSFIPTYYGGPSESACLVGCNVTCRPQL